MASAAVVVVGGGIVGSSIAFFLARKGVRDVMLLERDSIASGATGRSSALVRMHYTNPWDALLALKSYEVFTNWSEIVGGDCGFHPVGFLCLVGHHDRTNLQRNVGMLQSLGVETKAISAEDVKILQPSFNVDDVGAAAFEPRSGYADGYSAANGLARAARALGVRVRLGVGVLRIAARGDRVVGVETTQGFVEAPTVVLAAGAWSTQLAATAGVALPVAGIAPGAAALLHPAQTRGPSIVVLDNATGTYFRPDTGGQTVVGLRGLRPGYFRADPESPKPPVPPDWIGYTAARMVRRIPTIAQAAWGRVWAGIDGLTPDGHMILDGPAGSGVEGLFLATGMSATGFKTGPAVGMCMAELITNGHASTVDIRPFRLGRFKEGQPVTGRNEYSIPPLNLSDS